MIEGLVLMFTSGTIGLVLGGTIVWHIVCAHLPEEADCDYYGPGGNK